MSKKGNFCGPYRKTSKEFKSRGSTWEQQNHQPGWAQEETDYLTKNAGMGRVSYPHGTKTFDGGDKPVDGTAHVTKKGKTVKK